MIIYENWKGSREKGKKRENIQNNKIIKYKYTHWTLLNKPMVKHLNVVISFVWILFHCILLKLKGKKPNVTISKPDHYNAFYYEIGVQM